MTEVKCKVSDLREICDLVSMKGKNPQGKEYVAVPDFMIKANQVQDASIGPRLEVSATDSKNALAVGLKYKVDAILEWGDIPISDVETFVKYLDRFNATDNITLKTTQNKIILERADPKKVARIPLAESDSIESGTKGEEALARFPLTPAGYPKSAKTYLSLKLLLDAGAIKGVVEDGEVVKQRTYPWTIVVNAFSVKVGSEQLGEIETQIKTDKIELDPEVAGGIEPGTTARAPIGTKTSFSYGFDNLFSYIDGKIEIYLAENVEACPLYLVKKTEKFELRAILAPVLTE